MRQLVTGLLISTILIGMVTPPGLYYIGLNNIIGRPAPLPVVSDVAAGRIESPIAFRTGDQIIIRPSNPWIYWGEQLDAQGRLFPKSSGTYLASHIAMRYNANHLKNHQAWHSRFSESALAIWITRNWTADQILTAAAALADADVRSCRKHALRTTEPSGFVDSTIDVNLLTRMPGYNSALLTATKHMDSSKNASPDSVETSAGDVPNASAAATIDCGGRVVVTKPSTEESARISDVSSRISAVDMRFPPGRAPNGVKPVKGARVRPSGEIVLADGRIVVLDGISCSKEGFEYLSRYFLDPEATLLVTETGPAESGVVPAEVWVVERFGSGTSTTIPVETGITTGWSDAKRSTTSPHNDRFAALESAFANERRAYKASVP